jgi:hypothetical protein
MLGVANAVSMEVFAGGILMEDLDTSLFGEA